MDRLMTQEAPYPAELAELVTLLGYKPGWRFSLASIDRRQGGYGLTLVVQVTCEDTYGRGELTLQHDMPVPAVQYSRQAWQRWLLDQILLVEQHEALECFTIGGERVLAPLHSEGANQYLPAELAAGPQDRESDFMCNYVKQPATT